MPTNINIAHTTTDQNILRELLNDHDWMVRAAAASNSNIDPALLGGLVERRDCEPVLRGVATNPRATDEALEGLLVQAEYACVDGGENTLLCDIAALPNLPFRLQVQMTDTLDWNTKVADDADYYWGDDENIRIWCHLVKNPNLDSDILKRFAVSDAPYAPNDEAEAVLVERGVSIADLDVDAVFHVLHDRYHG